MPYVDDLLDIIHRLNICNSYKKCVRPKHEMEKLKNEKHSFLKCAENHPIIFQVCVTNDNDRKSYLFKLAEIVITSQFF